MTRLFWCLAALVTLTAPGCQPDQVQQCKSACEDVNRLECTDDDFLDCDAQCPEGWNETGLDYSDYVDCVYSQYQCDESGEYEFVPGSCTFPT